MDSTARKSFFSILFVAAMDNFGFAIVFSLFGTLLFSPDYSFLPPNAGDGIRNLYLGILFAAYPLTQLIGAPMIGDFADIRGRKKALNISVLGSVVGFALSAFAVTTYSLSFLIISRLISGFFGGNLSVCLTSIADLSPTEKIRARNFGIMTVVWPVSWTLAMLTAGYLSTEDYGAFFGPSIPFWVTAFLFFLSFIAILFFYEETHTADSTKKFDLIKGLGNISHAFTLKQVRPYLLAIFAWTLGWGLSTEWFGAYSILEFKASQLDISWGLIIQGVFWMLGGVLFNPLLVKRFHSLTIAIIGFGATGLLLITAGLFSSYWLFALFYFSSASFSAFAFSNGMNLCSLHAPSNAQGTVMGVSQSMMSLAWTIVPFCGAFMGANGAHWFYPIAGIFLLLGLSILLFQFSKRESTK